MADLTKKFIVKNGLQSPSIDFKESNGSSNTISVEILTGDTLSFSGDAGQLFSITDSLGGTLFSVSDISGIPTLEISDQGIIKLNERYGKTLINTTSTGTTDQYLIIGGGLLADSAQLTGYLEIDNASAPSTTTNRLYAVGGNVFWNGTQLNQGALDPVDQFKTVEGDTGTTTADSTNDTLIISGGTDISTSITGDTLTINFTGTSGGGGGGGGGFDSSDVTLATAAAGQVVDTAGVASALRASKYFATITGTGANSNNVYQAATVEIIHDGTDVYLTTYGILRAHTTDSDLGNFDADINSGQVRLLFDPAYSGLTIKTKRLDITT